MDTTPSTKKPVANHRTRVGRERRARTEAKIINAAMRVFAKKGPDAPIIDDFIKAAGVARGTFYNYYKSTEELLEATSKWLEDDMIESIETEIGNLKDPVKRLTTGVRLWMQKAEADPAWCAFVARVPRIGHLAEQQLTGDLRRGLRSGMFSSPSIDVARDLVVGTIRQAMYRLTEEGARKHYDREVAQMVMQGLGLDRRVIEKALSRTLPPLTRPTLRMPQSGGTP